MIEVPDKTRERLVSVLSKEARCIEKWCKTHSLDVRIDTNTIHIYENEKLLISPMITILNDGNDSYACFMGLKDELNKDTYIEYKQVKTFEEFIETLTSWGFIS